MKRLLLLGLYLVVTICLVTAQELTVKSMVTSPMDLSASTHPRLDKNGNACGLVKVRLAVTGAAFSGNVLGEVENHEGEYWVYMSQGSYMLKVRHPEFIALDMNFRDYGIRCIEAKTTYVLTLQKPQVPVMALTSGIEMGHDWVDLGLSIRWAAMNIGAKAPSEYGTPYQWAAITSTANCGWQSYNYCKGSSTSMTKYVTMSSYGVVDNKVRLENADDAAHVSWGGGWRLPTIEELDELATKCKWEWVKQDKHKGYLVTGPNGNTIFLPTAGYRFGSGTAYQGSVGYYWSSSLATSHPSLAQYLRFGSAAHSLDSIGRCFGASIRPVLDF